MKKLRSWTESDWGLLQNHCVAVIKTWTFRKNRELETEIFCLINCKYSFVAWNCMPGSIERLYRIDIHTQLCDCGCTVTKLPNEYTKRIVRARDGFRLYWYWYCFRRHGNGFFPLIQFKWQLNVKKLPKVFSVNWFEFKFNCQRLYSISQNNAERWAMYPILNCCLIEFRERERKLMN